MKKNEKITLLKQIDQYIKGSLPLEEIEVLWKKFLQYPEYFKWFETELHLRHLIEKGEKPRFMNSPKEAKIIQLSGVKSWIYSTAAVLVMVFGLQFFSISESEALKRLAIDNIGVSEMSGMPVFRSDDVMSLRFNSAINEAFSEANDGNYGEAIVQFRELLDEPLQSDQRLNVKMNLGILLYDSGRYDEAAAFFRSAAGLDDADIQAREKAVWFLGNTYLKLGDAENAKESMHQVYQMQGRYQEAASVHLKTLDLQLNYVPSVGLGL